MTLGCIDKWIVKSEILVKTSSFTLFSIELNVYKLGNLTKIENRVFQSK